MKVFKIKTFDLYDVCSLLNTYPAMTIPAERAASAYKSGWTETDFIFQIQRVTGATNLADDPVMNSLPFYKHNALGLYWEIDPLVLTLLQSIYRRFVSNVCFTIENDDELFMKVTNFFDTLLNLLTNTYPRYKIILSELETLQNKLIAPVKINRTDTNVGKIKDTPQADITPDSDAYNSAVTWSQNKSEVEDQKLDNLDLSDKLREKWQNVMLEWSNEFDRLFIDSANYEY